MKKILLVLCLSVFAILSKAQNGLENIFVERYYVTDAIDAVNSNPPLPVGSVTYRLYADMLPGYKVQTIFGSGLHPLVMTTTTEFFNQADYGTTIPVISANNTKKNTVMLDSWLTTGGACNGYNGIPKVEDNGVGNFVNSNIPQLLQNNAGQAGIPLTVQDGMYIGTVPSTITLGLDAVIGVFGDGTTNGNIFNVTNGAWACLAGAPGPIPANNKVLIAQITTDGIFHFEINIQIGTPLGGTENYVLSNPTGVELTIPSLTQTFLPVPVPPTVSITAPADNSSFSAGTPITITADANDGVGNITHVEFFVDGTSIGIDLTAPYSASYTGLTAASHIITAIATDNDGQTTTSSAVNITILGPPPTAFAVTGGGAYCQFSGGLPVGLANSETGVTYTLFKGGIAQVPTFAGTGAAIAIGNQLVGTYTVSGSNTNGTTPMTGTAVVTETLSLPVSVSIVASENNICAGTPVTYTATPVNGGTIPAYQWYLNGSTTGAGSATYIYTPANNDQVSVVLTSDLAGCISGNPATSNIVTMIVLPVSTAGVSVSADLNPSCSGSVVTYTAIPTNGGTPIYQWYVNSTPVGANQNTYSYAPLSADMVNVTMTSSVLCASGSPATSNTITMTVNPTITASVTVSADANPVCQGTSVTFTPSPVNGGTVPVYNWFVNNVLAVANMPAYSYVPDNNDEVKVVMISNATCATGTPAASNIITMSVTTPITVSVSIAASNNPVCAGTAVTYTATPINGGSTPAYQWYVNNLAVGTNLSTFSFVPLNNDAVKVLLTSNASCITGSPATSNSLNMAVNPNLPVSVTISAGSNPVCNATPVTFTASPVNGGSPSYQWWVNGSTAGTNSSAYTYTPANNDEVYVVMTSTLACNTSNPASSNIVTMSVNTSFPVSVSINPSQNPICSGSQVTFTASPVNGGVPSYQWYLNTLPVGTNQNSYSYIPVNNDLIYVVMNSTLGCTAGNPASSAITSMVVNALPVPAISGPVSACVNSTGNVYTTQSGESGYLWSVAGGTITAGSGTNSITVTWNTSGSQSVSVNYSNASSCSAASAVVYNVGVNPLPVPVITGSATACVSSSGNVYSTQAGMTGYTWTISTDGTITAGGNATSNTVTVTWNTAGPQTVSVNYTNTNTCTAINPTVYNVTVNPLPVPTISGPSTVCANSTGNVYTTETGMIGYSWIVSAGGTIASGAGTNAINVSWNTTGPKTVSINYTNANLCAAFIPTVYNVTVNSLPVPTVTGPAAVCALSIGNIYTTEAGMAGYIWTVSAGGTITAGAGTNVITVNWTNPGAKTVSVNYSNANSCSALTPAVYNVTVNALPVPTLSGITPAGVGTTQIYTTETGMTNYVWTVSAGGTISSGGTSTSNTVTVLWNTAGIQSVSVNYNNTSGCTAVNPTVYNVNVISIPPVAGTIAGVSVVCQGASGVAYSVAPIPNATGYVWTLPVGATIATGANTNSITVNFSGVAASGIITVYGTNTYGNGLPSPNFNVTVNTTPAPVITGSSVACSLVPGNLYTTQAGNIAYNWVVSAGGTITAGTGTNSISVTWNTTGNKTVSVNYSNTSGCQGLAPATFNVNVDLSPAPSIQGSAELCSGSTGVTYTTEPGFLNYSWTISYGGIITAGLNTNTVTVDWGSAGSRYIAVNYQNASGCEASQPTVQDVTVFSIPVPVISGPDAVCEGSTAAVYNTQPNNTNYVWTVSSGGIITTGSGTNAITVSWSAGGNQTVSVNYTNSLGCAATEPAVFNVTVAPKPSSAGTITGTSTLCAGTQGVVYTVPVIANALTYNWTIPSGAAIASGANTNSITVNFANTATSGVIKVNGVNDCGSGSSSPNYNVVVNPVPAAPVITQHGDTLTSSAIIGNQWYLYGVEIPGATGKKHIAVYTGNYTVVVTTNGCSSEPSNSILVLPVSVSDITFDRTFEVYPNPNKGQFDIKVQSSRKIECTLEIYNSLGSLILKQDDVLIDGTFNRHIDLNGSPTGSYLVVLRSRDNSVIRKVIITK